MSNQPQNNQPQSVQTWKPGLRLQLQTEHFVLQSLIAANADNTYTSWWNDADIQRGFNSKARGWDNARAAKHIQQFDNKSKFHLGIYDKQTKKLIGFFAIFANHQQKVAKTNVLLGDKSYWGKGVVQEVRTRVLDFLFNRLSMEKVEGEILGRNLPSIFNYKALGFKAEGIRRQQILSVDGGRTEIYHFGLLKPEWIEFKKTLATTKQDANE